MSEAESTIDEILSSIPGERIKATDLDFYALFRRQGEEGRLFFNKRRAIIFDTEAVGNLRQQLIETLGRDSAESILTRFGYTQGFKDAELLGKTFDWESDADWLTAGASLQGLEGFVSVEPKKVEFDRDTGNFHMHGIWHNSYEAEEHLKRYAPSNNPVCWILTGYASGYATRFLEREVLAIETKCIGKGDEHCYFEIRPIDEWGSEAEPYLEFLKEVALSDALSLKDTVKYKQTKAALAERAVELETVAQVSVAASTILEVDKLLYEIANLTKERFRLYHTHIYLLNEAGNLLNLVAGAGQVGQQMVAQEWSIPLDHEHSLVARAARTHQGVIVNDVRAEPDFLPNDLLPDTRSELAVPLVAGSRILGVIDVQSSEVGRFTDEDLKIHTILAAQVAVALRNAHLYTQVQEALTETEVLYEVSAQINTAGTLEEVLQATTAPAMVTGADNAYLLSFEFDDGSQPEWAKVTAAWGREESPSMPIGTRFYLPDHPFAKLWLEDPHNPLFISSVADDERIDSATRATFLENGTMASVLMPLILAERWIGLISINWTSPHSFTDTDQRLYKAMTTQSAVVVNNLLLLEDTRVALAETANLYEASRRINEAGDLQEIVAAVVETGPVSVIDRAELEIFERDTAGEVEALMVVANWHHGGETPPSPIGTRFLIAEFPYRKLFLSPDPIFFDDAQHDERLSPETVEVMQQLNIRAMAVLPLWVGPRQLGVLMLEAQEAYHFTEREIQPYIALARQMGVALENQRLLTETSVALAEVEATQRRYTVQAWEAYRTRSESLSFEQIRSDKLPAEASHTISQRQTKEAGPFLSIAIGGKEQEEDVVSEPERANRVEPVKSSFLVPLTVRGEVVGVLGLEDTDEREWTPEEKTLVEAIAQQLAQAAENLRLIDETQQRVARERRVNEIGEKIQAARSLEEALQIAVKEVGMSLQAPETSVKLEVK